VPPKCISAGDDARDGAPTERVIDLWHASLQHSGWRQLADLLSDGERRRADSCSFERDARRFTISHAVLRTLLSRATGISAREVKLQGRPGLKPALEGSLCQPIHFSLSRS
jgi:phosphopantetheinyl transferase